MAARPEVVVVFGPHSARLGWSPEAEAELEAFATVRRVAIDRPAASPPPELRAALRAADALLLCGWDDLGTGRLDAALLASAPRLRFIGSSSHYRQAEYVDLAAAEASGIVLVETAPAMAPWVAEYELALGLAALRRIPQEHGVMAAGGWVDHRLLPVEPDRLARARVGLASFGAVHRHLVRLLAPFEVDWGAYDPHVAAGTIEAAGGRRVEGLVELAAGSRLLFVATPPNRETIGLIGADVVAALPAGALLVLVSRMAVVDQDALVRRLERGDIAAAIDVYEPEPPPPDHPLRRLPNVVCTPHRAGGTVAAHRAVFLAQCVDARRHFAGEPPLHPLRPELVRLFEAPARPPSGDDAR